MAKIFVDVLERTETNIVASSSECFTCDGSCICEVCDGDNECNW